jgi:hypothetical protein
MLSVTDKPFKLSVTDKSLKQIVIMLCVVMLNVMVPRTEHLVLPH